jgi:hypothetical protein
MSSRRARERLLAAGFLVAHGLIHAAIYAMSKPAEAKAPFDAGRSWALSAVHVAPQPVRTASTGLGWLTAALFAVSAVALLVDVAWWAPAAALAAAVGLVLELGWFHPWLTAGVLLDVGVLAAVAAEWPDALF